MYVLFLFMQQTLNNSFNLPIPHFMLVLKTLEKTEGQSIIDNPEAMGTLDTQGTGRRQTQHNNTTDNGNNGHTRHRTKTNRA